MANERPQTGPEAIHDTVPASPVPMDVEKKFPEEERIPHSTGTLEEERRRQHPASPDREPSREDDTTGQQGGDRQAPRNNVEEAERARRSPSNESGNTSGSPTGVATE